MTVDSKLTSTVTPCSSTHYEKHFIDTGNSNCMWKNCEYLWRVLDNTVVSIILV